MFFLISNDVILLQGQANSFDEFKKNFPIPPSLDVVGVSNEYIEIPDDIFKGITGYISFDGTSGGMGGMLSNPDISGITYSELFIRGDSVERMSVLGIDTDPGNTGLNDGFFSFSDDGVDSAAFGFENVEGEESNAITFDPRLSPNITLSQLQTIKGLEAENQFIEEGLGATQSISFEMDDGSNSSLVFDNRRNTILDLLLIKQYSDLNQTIINSSDQTSVNVTGLKIIDSAGTITSLSPTEFGKCMHSLLASFYENYMGQTDMKNIIENPVGSTDAEKITYLLDNTNVSFTTSMASDFVKQSAPLKSKK